MADNAQTRPPDAAPQTRVARLLTAVAFALAAVLALGAAQLGARAIERAVAAEARAALAADGLGWATVETDGLLLRLRGEAPTEAARFRAISAANKVTPAERILDQMTVAATDAVAVPDFAI